MRIEVTQEHIDRANELLKQQGNEAIECCPVALALRDATGNKWCAGQRLVWVDREDNPITIDSPLEVTVFIRRYDSHSPNVAPFSFWLDI